MHRFLQFLRDERGATTIEYGIIAALLSVAIAGFMFQFGEQMRDNFFALFAEALAEE